MKITLKTLYVICALIEIAKGDKTIKASEIAKRHSIPSRFLEITLSELKSEGIVDSKKGIHGGFYLSRPKEEISLYDIVKITQNIELFNFSQLKDESCRLDNIFNNLNTQVKNLFKMYTLKDLVEEFNKSIDNLAFII